ncbi:putative secologanin synthase [Helianthus debilis subsp. tardiflorus]
MTIMDPELIKEVLVNNKIYKKPNPNPMVKLMVPGIPTYEDQKWAKHRKIVAPAFTQDRLKVPVVVI